MKWFLRFLLWATLLAYPCFVLASSYERLLFGILSAFVHARLQHDPTSPPDFAAANVLGVFAAMCLATTGAPWRVRCRSLIIGLAIMPAIECACALASIGVMFLQASRGPWPPSGRAAFNALIAVPRFGAGPAIWLAMFRNWPEGLFAHAPGVPRAPVGRAAAPRDAAPSFGFARASRVGSRRPRGPSASGRSRNHPARDRGA